MLAQATCRNITTEPPPARPLVLSRTAPGRLRGRNGVTFGRRVRQGFARGAVGIVEGLLAGCLTGVVLGTACGFLLVVIPFLCDSGMASWSDRIICGIFFSFYAAVIGAVIGAVPGLLVGSVIGAVSAVLRGGPAGRIAGLVLGAALSPLLLAGSPWENFFVQALMVAPGALGGFRVAAVVGKRERGLARRGDNSHRGGEQTPEIVRPTTRLIWY